MKTSLLTLALTVGLTSSVQAESKVVAGYFADWQYFHRNYPYNVKNVPAENLTHMIYAFLSMCGPHDSAPRKTKTMIRAQCKNKAPYTATIVDAKSALLHDFGPVNVDVDYKGHFAQLAQLKANNPDLTILSSFGGWTMSEPFHAMAKDPKAVKHFAYSAAELISEYPFFDGIDINWEFPGGGGMTTQPWNPLTKLDEEEQARERAAYTELMHHLRDALDRLGEKNGRTYQLTTAAGVADKVTQIDWTSVASKLDHIFLMTFDYLGGWGIKTGHSANLFATDRSIWGMGTDVFVQQMVDLQVPKEKIVVGTAFFGRGWQGTQDYDGGLPHQNLISERGAQFGTGEDGFFMYWDLKENYGPNQGYQYHYDQESQAPYLWNPYKKVFISFEDPRSLRAKVQWVKEKNLGGVFAWELSGDPHGEMIEAMHKEMVKPAGLTND